jgi:hypothetical protein
MSKRIFVILAAAALGLSLCSSPVSSQERGEIYEVDILHDQQGWHIEPCPMPGINGDTWRIKNLSSDTVWVRVMIIADDKNPSGYILAPMDSVDHTISWATCGIMVLLGPSPSGSPVAECERPCGPVLTRWGTVALVISLTSVTVWLLLRKKTRWATSV